MLLTQPNSRLMVTFCWALCGRICSLLLLLLPLLLLLSMQPLLGTLWQHVSCAVVVAAAMLDTCGNFVVLLCCIAAFVGQLRFSCCCLHLHVFLCCPKLCSTCLQAYIDIRSLRVHNIVFAPEQNPSAYLLHERFLYTSKNGSWQRARDFMADTVHSELLHYLCLANVRSLPFQVSVTVDRDWFLLAAA